MLTEYVVLCYPKLLGLLYVMSFGAARPPGGLFAQKTVTIVVGWTITSCATGCVPRPGFQASRTGYFASMCVEF